MNQQAALQPISIDAPPAWQSYLTQNQQTLVQQLQQLHRMAQLDGNPNGGFVAKVQLANGASAIGRNRRGVTAEQSAVDQLRNQQLLTPNNGIQMVLLANNQFGAPLSPNETDQAAWRSSVYAPNTVYVTMRQNQFGQPVLHARTLADMHPNPEIFKARHLQPNLMHIAPQQITASPQAQMVMQQKQLSVDDLSKLYQSASNFLSLNQSHPTARKPFAATALASLYSPYGLVTRQPYTTQQVDWTPGAGDSRSSSAILIAAQEAISRLTPYAPPNTPSRVGLDAVAMAGKPNYAQLVKALGTMSRNGQFQHWADKNTLIAYDNEQGQLRLCTIGDLIVDAATAQ